MQRYTVFFTPRAEHQLAELYAYIADQGGEPRAEAYVGNIVATCLGLTAFPLRGTARDDIRPNMRTIGYAKRVTIAFSVNVSTQAVVILGIFYGGQDLERLSQDIKEAP